MKRYIIPIACLSFITIFVRAQTSYSIDQVVVYRQGAKISASAHLQLKAGNFEHVIGDLPSSLNANSLQVSLRGKAILLSASSRINYLGKGNTPARIKELQDSIQLIGDKIDWLNNEQAIYQGEEKLIVDNQKITNEKEKITAAELGQLADFYVNRITSIRKKTYSNTLEIRKQNEIKTRLVRQLSELKANTRQKPTGEVVLNISADQPTRVTVNFSFYTTDAGWNPLYDLRSPGIDKPLNLVYKANVHQTTGSDWNNVDLVISTGNPSVNNERPVLNPWYINFYEPPAPTAGYGTYKKAATTRSTANMLEMGSAEPAAQRNVSLDKQPPVPYQVQLNANQMSAEYNIKVAQDIPSDGKDHIVPISQFSLPATYVYQAVPKLNQHAFLLAKAGGYEQYNLLPGQLNLFFEGMYVGSSQLNPETTGDSLLISLGRDDRISIQRNELKDFTSKQVAGNNKKVQKGYEIIMKNNKTIPVDIEILDQVPISQNKDIVVDLDDSGGAAYVADYGKLTWKEHLKPGETKKIRFTYTVKYPKDKVISGF